MKPGVKPLPCPFCGNDPDEFYSNGEATIHCIKETCRVKPGIDIKAKSLSNESIGQPDSWHYDYQSALTEAALIWNIRR